MLYYLGGKADSMRAVTTNVPQCTGIGPAAAVCSRVSANTHRPHMGQGGVPGRQLGRVGPGCGAVAQPTPLYPPAVTSPLLPLSCCSRSSAPPDLDPHHPLTHGLTVTPWSFTVAPFCPNILVFSVA